MGVNQFFSDDFLNLMENVLNSDSNTIISSEPTINSKTVEVCFYFSVFKKEKKNKKTMKTCFGFLVFTLFSSGPNSEAAN